MAFKGMRGFLEEGAAVENAALSGTRPASPAARRACGGASPLRSADRVVTAHIRTVIRTVIRTMIRTRASYGARRVHAPVTP